ncbi:MAG: hypothetical protein ACKO1U_09750, partial [Bacteroidota bacterium]
VVAVKPETAILLSAILFGLSKPTTATSKLFLSSSGRGCLLAAPKEVAFLNLPLSLSLYFSLSFLAALDYCNQALVKYKDEETVWLASGYMFPLGRNEKLPSTFFLPTLSCWGWCTWRRAWNKFNADASGMLRFIEENGLTSRFDLHSSYPYTEMLRLRAADVNQSWDVCWYASFFLGNGLCLYPGISLVENIGMDGSGTHWTGLGTLTGDISKRRTAGWIFPEAISSDDFIQKRLEKTLKKEFYPGRIRSFLRKLKNRMSIAF